MKESPLALNFKKSNIRIWIHQRNLVNLQQVVWEGHGGKLLVEHSNNPKIKKFLEGVPHLMGLIKDIHSSVLSGDLDALKAKIASPVPTLVLSGKDINGLSPLHKAAGLGRDELAEFLVQEYPRSVYLTDSEARTPLHFAALLKDDGKMMNLLLENGADESALDNKQKTAAYYKTRTSEIDSKLLNVIPECPRTAKDSYLTSFDWGMLVAQSPSIEEIHKIEKKTENGNDTQTPTEEEASENATKEVENGEEEKPEHNGETNNNEDPEAVDTNGQSQEDEEPERNNNEESVEAEPEAEPEMEQEAEPDVEPEQEVEAEPQVETEPEPEPEVESEAKPEPEVETLDDTEPNAEDVSRPVSAAVSTKSKEETEVESVGVIEGVVHGENEVESLNEQGQGPVEETEDSEVTELVEAGNMEQLASLVLAGEGERLMGQSSDNVELQSFLDNVPVYMSKINRIHVAAKDGSLRELQAALDRRKFAIAKDKSVSPNGASPLHTAVVFTNTSIVRYLAGRFPETALVVDDNGRTPLHYAAVLADNGHYYNLMMHLGADSRVKDKYGRTPEHYRTHKEDFSHRSLLNDYGVEESASEELLNDKVLNDTCSARKDLDDEEMLNVLERCFHVLHGRRNSNAVSAASVTSTGIQHSSNSSLISKHTKRYIYDNVKTRVTKLDHNLYDLIWPSVKKLPSEASFRVALEQDFPAGIVAPDFYSYRVFAEYIEPIIKEYNAIDMHHELGLHPASKFADQDDKTIDLDFDLDPQGRWIIAGIVSKNEQADMPFFATEEGRYLASSLGDPLIKGLTEVANKRPDDPIAYLATYLYNFANNRHSTTAEKTRMGAAITGEDEDQAIPANIDVVTVDPDESYSEDESAFNTTSRDEHGQSMLHFAAARSHGRNALFQLLVETEINVALRDELYRTARDISIQANIPENTSELDRYVIAIATKGDTDKLVELLLEGYDHLTDIVDEADTPIIEAVAQHNQPDTVSFLQSILAFEEKRERVHHAIRLGSISDVTSLLADENETGSGKLLAIGRNNYGRCSLHIAVLCQQEEIVDYLANTFPDTLRLGDNLERTALHYAMGVENMDIISRVLIKAGARRIVKDLKGRQPTYYFLNKLDIQKLQEEEETF